MQATEVETLMAANVPLHVIEQEADWRDMSKNYLNNTKIVRRYLEQHELCQHARLCCESGLGGVFSLVYAGRNDSGQHVVMVDNKQSSFHGRRFAIAPDDVPSVIWIEERRPL